MLAVEFVNSPLLRLNWPGVLCNEDIKKTLVFCLQISCLCVCVCVCIEGHSSLMFGSPSVLTLN